MSFLYGVLGTIAALLLFAAGFFAGWKGKEKFGQRLHLAEEKALNERERQMLIEEQEAFHVAMNYNIDMAYGLDGPLQADKEAGE